MKKRGQLLSQPFILILALIIGSLILFFGVRTIIKLKTTVQEVELHTIINNLKEEVEEYYYLDEGSSETIKLRLPEKIKYLCIKNDTYTDRNNQMFQTYPDLKEILRISQDNIFFMPMMPNKKTSFKIKNIIVPEDQVLICKNKDIKITSKGLYVELS